MNSNGFRETVARIRLVLADCDGVLTDGGVYYSAAGEEMKRFNIRDGMGVERLRLAGIEVGIVSGQRSPSLVKRAKELQITELHLGTKNKTATVEEIRQRRGLRSEEVAFIGDDVNDLALAGRVGLFACPADALHYVRERADYVCSMDGGHGAFRELAELIIAARSEEERGGLTVWSDAGLGPTPIFTFRRR
jgi:3-deoxy-D-manno-octulosonate 8-phosphate phosphatase (KDO 8-P phosphatase)